MSALDKHALLKQDEEELKQWDISYLPTKTTSRNLFNELSQFKVNNHDQCLVEIIKQWDDSKIVRITSDDVKNLLKDSIDEYDDNDIYAKLWELAVQIRKINFIMHRQKMVHIPPPVQKDHDPWEEFKDHTRSTVDLQNLDPRVYTLNQLNQKEQSDKKSLTKLCEGCHQTIKNIYKDDVLCYNAKIKEDNFYFHDDYCVILRTLKDVIRIFALEEGCADQTKYWSASVMKLIEKPADAINLDQKLPKPLEKVLKKSNHKETIMSYKRAHAEQMKKLVKHLNSKESEYKNLPLEIKYSNLNIYGKGLLTFIIYELLEQKSDALLLILKYILSQLSIVFAINIVNEARNKPWFQANVDNLDAVLTIIINTSTYTVATALYWSAMMKAEAANDFTRAEEFEAIANKYIEMALQIVDAAESDHILSLLLETPSNIHRSDSHNQSALDIALKHDIEDFLNNSRVQHLFSHMWSEYNYLDPEFQSFRSKDISMAELFKRNLIKYPATFYYCPVGRYFIETFMYIVYVLIVTFVTFQHHHITGDLSTLESIMWLFNFGYICSECQQVIAYRIEYLTDIGNFFDIMITMNWILLAIIRFGCKNGTFECQAHDSHPSLIFMLIFCVQICVLWSRIALLFRTSTIVGPLIAMIPKMVEDIFVWIFVLSIFFVGFSFGANYIISGDITEECADESLSSFSLVFEYVFLLLMGQSDWEVLNPNDCISNGRSIILKLVMWIFSMMGTILLLNLLIAMMASTYDNLREEPAQVVNVAKSKLVYVFATHLTIMPAPFNLLVYALGIIWIFVECIILAHSNGTKMINISKLIPVKTEYKENISNEIRDEPSNEPSNESSNEFLIDRPEYLLQNNSVFKLNIFDQRRKYCRFCRYRIDKVEIIKYPFRETIFDESLKPPNCCDELNLTQKDCGNCPKCYRPFESEDRLIRRQVILEIISFYVFMVTLYIPLIIIMSTLTLLAEIKEKYKKYSDTTPDKLEEPQVATAVYYDDYIHRIEKTLNAEQPQQEKQYDVEDSFKKLNKRLDLIEKKINIDTIKHEMDDDDVNEERDDDLFENKENEEEVKQDINIVNIPKWGQQLRCDLIKLQEKIKSVDSMTDEQEEQIQIKQKELRHLKKQKSLAQLTMNDEAKDFAEIQQETKENELENDIAILETKKSNLTKQIKQYKAKKYKDIDALKQMGQNVDDLL